MPDIAEGRAVIESEYLDFQEVANKRPDMKTKVWAVRSKRKGNVLGFIRWYGAWRQYTFWPMDATIWNWKCLKDIHDFLHWAMADRAKERGWDEP